MTGAIDMDDNDITNVKRISFEDGDASISEVKDEDDMATDSAIMICTQQSIKAYVDAVPKGTFSKTLIKVMPNEFIVNDDYAGRAANMIEDDTTDTLGYRLGNANTEAYAFIKIPQGYTATHVQVYASASTSSAVETYSFNYQTGATVSKGSGDFNASIDITDLGSGLVVDLVIKVLPASNSTIIYGANVTIAAT